MSIRISTHAIERYIERIHPNTPYDDAKSIILDLMITASRQKEKTHAGDTIYLAPNCRLIVAEENGHREVITVIPLYSNPNDLRATPEIALELKLEFEKWQREQDSNSTESKLREQISQLMTGIERRQKFIDQAINSNRPKEIVGKFKNLTEQNLSLKRKLDKQVRHNKHLEQNISILKRALSLISYLISSNNISDAKDEIKNLLPWMTSKGVKY